MVLACGAALLVAAPASAGPTPLSAARQAMLQRALDDARARSGAPGVSVAIVAEGHLLWAAQSGTVNRATGAPVRADTLFSLASVSKLFTAAMVMQLVESGALRLDDPLSKYVPVSVRNADRVTIAELLDHTSGYPDDEDDPWMLHRLADPNFAWTRSAVFAHQPGVRSKPGTRYAYCNSCYVMLGEVIERAGGVPVGQFLRRRILDPLGLEDDVDIDRVAAVAPRITHGYDLRHRKLVDASRGARDLGISTADWGPVWTDGGVVATASGVARFTDALFAGHVVSARSLQWLLAPDPPGIAVESYRFDHRLWRGHSGFYVGYTAETWYDAQRHLTITVLANRTDDNDPATEVWNRLSSAYDHM